MTNELLPELIHSSSRLTHTGIRITCFCFCVSVNNNEAQNIMYHKKLPSQNKISMHLKQTNVFWPRQFILHFCQSSC